MHSLNNYLSPIIAHRGASALAPENTLAAFQKAATIGAKWIEFDVMLSACGEAVVIHDETLDRTTNGKGEVSHYTYAELRKLDAGSWFSSAFVNEKIPTLLEVLQLVREYKLMANIEIKPSLGREEQTVTKVLQIVAHYWPTELPPPLISSFSLQVQLAIRNYFPASVLAYLMNEWQPDWKKSYDALQCASIHVNQAILNQTRINEIKQSGCPLLAYTVDDPIRARELFACGVDAIFSNCPLGMKVFL
jgi:glycerophosphoryl diester phosphodiesterase